MGWFGKSFFGRRGKGGIGAWFHSTKKAIHDGLNKVSNNVTHGWEKEKSWWASHGKPIMDHIQSGADKISKVASNKFVQSAGKIAGGVIGEVVDPLGGGVAGEKIAKNVMGDLSGAGKDVAKARKFGRTVSKIGQGAVYGLANIASGGYLKARKHFKAVQAAYKKSKALGSIRRPLILSKPTVPDYSARPEGQNLQTGHLTKAAMTGGGNPSAGVDIRRSAV